MIPNGYMDFIEEELPKLRLKRLNWWRKSPYSKHDTLRYCLRTQKITNGIIAEFGVFKGTTIRAIARKFKNRQIFGFDSFEGFPNDGRKDWNQNFSLNGDMPIVPNNVTLIKGFFEDTLPVFISNRKGGHFSLLHIDCDIYSSTKTIFTKCRDMIRPGCLIIFDELLHYNGFLDNELLAFYEFVTENELGFEWVAIRGGVMEASNLPSRDNLMTKDWKMADFRKRGYEQEVAVRIVDRDKLTS